MSATHTVVVSKPINHSILTVQLVYVTRTFFSAPFSLCFQSHTYEHKAHWVKVVYKRAMPYTVPVPYITYACVMRVCTNFSLVLKYKMAGPAPKDIDVDVVLEVAGRNTRKEKQVN